MILVFQSSFSIDLNSRKVEFYKSAQDMMMICPILTKKINQKNFIKKKRKKIFSSKELIELKLNPLNAGRILLRYNTQIFH